MTRVEMLLTILAEECMETAQRASKAIRFGLNEVQEGQGLDNAQRIIYEFNDIVGTMEMLSGEKHIPYHVDAVAAGLKKIKIEKLLTYSFQQGALSDTNTEALCGECWLNSGQDNSPVCKCNQSNK